MKTGSYKVQDCLGYWFSVVAKAIEAEFEKRLSEFGVTRSGYAILHCIESEGCESAAEIADYLNIDRSAVTRHLDRLEKSKMIKRVPLKSDKRFNITKLTSFGVDTLPKLIAESKEVNEMILTNLSETEVEQSKKVISKILKSGFGKPNDL